MTGERLTPSPGFLLRPAEARPGRFCRRVAALGEGGPLLIPPGASFPQPEKGRAMTNPFTDPAHLARQAEGELRDHERLFGPESEPEERAKAAGLSRWRRGRAGGDRVRHDPRRPALPRLRRRRAVPRPRQPERNLTMPRRERSKPRSMLLPTHLGDPPTEVAEANAALATAIEDSSKASLAVREARASYRAAKAQDAAPSVVRERKQAVEDAEHKYREAKRDTAKAREAHAAAIGRNGPALIEQLQPPLDELTEKILTKLAELDADLDRQAELAGSVRTPSSSGTRTRGSPSPPTRRRSNGGLSSPVLTWPSTSEHSRGPPYRRPNRQ